MVFTAGTDTGSKAEEEPRVQKCLLSFFYHSLTDMSFEILPYSSSSYILVFCG